MGKAQGSIFGAEGTVTITVQKGEDIQGIVEGGNFLGTAKFGIQGKIQGNRIYGEKEGNVFQGILYPDGSIRGAVRAVDGDTYHVFLRRAYPSPQAFDPRRHGQPAPNPYGQYPQGYPYQQYYQYQGR